MKQLLQIGSVLLLAALATGCASTRAYFADRGHDAADIFTLTVEKGVGAKARLGPLAVGCMNSDGTLGLRGGGFVAEERGYQFLGVAPGIQEGAGDVSVFGFYNVETLHSDNLKARRKNFHAGREDSMGLWLQQYDEGGDNPAYYSEIELTVGVGLIVRIGFNPGELLDFILGWFGVDIFDDDIETQSLNEISDLPAKTGDKPAPNP